MLDDAAGNKTSVLGRVPPEKLVAIALVALLHLLLVWLLLRASLIEIAPRKIFHEAPITLWLQTAPEHKKPEPKPEEKPKKEKPAPAPVKRAIGPPVPAPSVAPPSSEYNGLRALGRYLNNCSAGNYEALSQRDLAHCLGNIWGPSNETKQLRLGQEPPSVWKTQKEREKAPPRKLETQCPVGSPNSNLGLPCYHFAN